MNQKQKPLAPLLLPMLMTIPLKWLLPLAIQWLGLPMARNKMLFHEWDTSVRGCLSPHV
jgi:hypothetical protein